MRLIFLTGTLAAAMLVLGSLPRTHKPTSISRDGSVAEVVVRAAGPTLIVEEVVVRAGQPAAAIPPVPSAVN